MINSKKGSLGDILFITITVIFLAISFVTIFAVFDRISDNFVEQGNLDTANTEMISNYSDRLPGTLQILFVFALIVMAMVSVISAFFVLSHPAFYIIMAVILGFMVWVDTVLANAFQTFAEGTTIVAFASQMPMIVYIMQNFPLVMLVISFVIAIVMTAKR